jgi:hypothetical protein
MPNSYIINLSWRRNVDRRTPQKWTPHPKIASEMRSKNQQAYVFFVNYITRFLSKNEAAFYIVNELPNFGVGLMPVINHCTLHTPDVDKRAGNLLPIGFSHDQALVTLKFYDWWAKLYRKPGYPSFFVDQAFAGKRGELSLILDWIHIYGD